jgi:hypothetical protein
MDRQVDATDHSLRNTTLEYRSFFSVDVPLGFSARFHPLPVEWQVSLYFRLRVIMYYNTISLLYEAYF